MNKDDSQALKGLAILMMLWGHLFGEIGPSLQTTDFSVSGLPLCCIFARLCNPVYIFLIITGYGLYKSYRANGGNFRVRSNFGLWLRYLIIVTVFVGLAILLGHDEFADVKKYLLNISMVRADNLVYYWFLLPYIIVTTLNRPLNTFFDRHWKIALLSSCFIYFAASFVISRFRDVVWTNSFYNNALNTLTMVFPYYMGVTLAKFDVFGKIRTWMSKVKHATLYLVLVFVCITAVRMTISSFAANIFYEPVVAMFFVLIRRPAAVDKVFGVLGRHSANIWFIHGWFNVRLFSDQLYALQYPVLIFVVLVAVSFAVSVLFNQLFKIIPILNRPSGK